MKLRNKKTGEIREIKEILIDGMFNVKSLAELNEEWEDYEEPKSVIEDIRLNDIIAGRHIVEIDFTKVEEAEKAVEKLKAYKRLKDKGFRFDGYDSGHNSNKELCGQAYFKAGNFWFDIKADLDLLFGSEG